MVETTLVKEWLYNTLSGDATLMTMMGGGVPRIYDGFVPSNPKNPYKFPAIIYQLYFASEDYRTVFNRAQRLWSVLNFYVKAIDNVPNFNRIKDIANRIDDLIDGKQALVTGGEIVSCLRTRPFEYQEVLTEVQYNHLGGLYQITVRRDN